MRVDGEDGVPEVRGDDRPHRQAPGAEGDRPLEGQGPGPGGDPQAAGGRPGGAPVLCRKAGRSEEHTSELQSRLHLVCRLLLEKKKKNNKTQIIMNMYIVHNT